VSLTYIPPTRPSRPFKTGDIVDTMDREHGRMETVKVVRATRYYVRTSCGRRWTYLGYWVGENGVWPFPWIRHSRKKTYDAAVTVLPPNPA
jgi:hypothetical protein